MLKYLLPVILFSLFFLLPMKELKDDVKFVNEEIFYLELEIIKKDKTINGLELKIKKLEEELKQKDIKPVIKKRINKNPDIVKNKEIVINDTVKTP